MSELARSLVPFSLQILPTMYRADVGLFCEARDREGNQVGTSMRYTLMCLIGLRRAADAGIAVPFDLEELYDRAMARPAESITDTALRLWVSSLFGRFEAGRELSVLLEQRIDNTPSDQRTGMHMGLALAALVAFGEHGRDPDAAGRAGRIRDRVIAEHGRSESGLFFHTPGGTLRRTLPNFATQAYLMHGLARHTQWSGDATGGDLAWGCAVALSELQRDDGGWPWIYRTSGGVVEDFEVYSVHQDGMAPMAFHVLVDIGKDAAPLVERGLSWLAGDNQLGINMVDRDRMLIYRSLRRPRPVDRIMLAVNTASASVSGRAPLHAVGSARLNTTCRPYHAGWILEAWAGRKTDAV